jgi:integrase
MPREWRGSVYARGRRLYLKVRDVRGVWVPVRTPYAVGEEQKALVMLSGLRDRVQAAERVTDGGGAPTVKTWGVAWLKTRPEASRWYDESRLDLHVYPVIGGMPLTEVRARHVLDLVRRVRANRAARTVRNVYAVLQALMRDAVIEGLIDTSPCVLGGTRHLPPAEDAEPEWRAGAVFTRAEFERLVTDPEIAPDDRIAYAVLGLGMLRHGEAAGLRWRHYQPEHEPLGRLVVAGSYRRRGTKTVPERWMPVHPSLAAALAAWKLHGWPALMGREPGSDDLVLPLPVTARRKAEAMRTKGLTLRRLLRELRRLGWRSRRVHDLRRTGISLAISDGASEAILKWGTHAPPRHVMGLYTSIEWGRLCAEVERMRVRTKLVRSVVQIGRRKGAPRP